MTTTSPSWFPSWPAGFPDLEAAYKRTVPRQWPWGLYEPDTDEHRDLQAFGAVFSWIAQGAEWIKRRLWPQHDDDGQFFHLFEEMIGIKRRATIALRRRAIISYLRFMRGTATKATVQAIMGPIFNTEPSRIAFSYASIADVIAAAPDTEEGWAEALNSLHIYNNDAGGPDPQLFADAVAAIKHTWQTWTGGAHQALLYDTQGGYDTACYGA